MNFIETVRDHSIINKVVDSCVNGISLSDPNLPDCPIVYVNAAFERLTGYRADEIVGRNCRFLQGVDRDQENIQLIRRALSEKLPISCELKNYRKSGELFYNYLSISPIFNEQGHCTYYMGIQYDITKQVMASEELRMVNQFLEGYIRHP